VTQLIYDNTVHYLGRIWAPEAMEARILHAIESLKDVDFDTIAVTGLSGTLFGITLAHRLHKNFLVIRKAGAKSHSWIAVEGQLGHKWLFVDDLIDSGATLARVMLAVAKLVPRYQECDYVGAYLYSDEYYRKPEDEDGWQSYLKQTQGAYTNV
jgi:adenine/guanine phosphoribosyltransferase-like PRPP-binding protein